MNKIIALTENFRSRSEFKRYWKKDYARAMALVAGVIMMRRNRKTYFTLVEMLTEEERQTVREMFMKYAEEESEKRARR